MRLILQNCTGSEHMAKWLYTSALKLRSFDSKNFSKFFSHIDCHVFQINQIESIELSIFMGLWQLKMPSSTKQSKLYGFSSNFKHVLDMKEATCVSLFD